MTARPILLLPEELPDAVSPTLPTLPAAEPAKDGAESQTPVVRDLHDADMESLRRLTDAHLLQWIEFAEVKRDIADEHWELTGDFSFAGERDSWQVRIWAAQREQVRRVK